MQMVIGGQGGPSGIYEDRWDAIYRASRGVLPWELDQVPEEILIWAAMLPPGATIFEFGCGRGRHSRLLARLGFRVTAMDVSGAAIEEAERAARGLATITFVRANILDYRSAEPADFAFDYSLFHHIDPHDWNAYAATVAHSVRPSGAFAIVCYSDDDPDAGGSDKRVGSLGNPIYHPTRNQVVDLFRRDFAEEAYRITTLGRGGKHVAHNLLFRRRG